MARDVHDDVLDMIVNAADDADTVVEFYERVASTVDADAVVYDEDGVSYRVSDLLGDVAAVHNEFVERHSDAAGSRLRHRDALWNEYKSVFPEADECRSLIGGLHENPSDEGSWETLPEAADGSDA